MPPGGPGSELVWPRPHLTEMHSGPHPQHTLQTSHPNTPPGDGTAVQTAAREAVACGPGRLEGPGARCPSRAPVGPRRCWPQRAEHSAPQLTQLTLAHVQVGLQGRTVSSHVCTCGYACKCACVCTHGHESVWMCARIWVHACECMQVCTRVCCICVCTCVPLHVSERICVHACVVWARAGRRGAGYSSEWCP